MAKMNNNPIGCLLFGAWGRDFALMVLRLVAGAMVITHVIPKIENFDLLSRTFPDPIGLGSKFSLVLVIFAELVCSIMVMAGLLTRLAAFALVFSMGVAAFIAHQPFSFAGSEMPILYMVVFAFFVLGGAGRFSVDELFRRKSCV